MVKRKLTLKLYVVAFIITVAIFLLGVYVGQLADSQVSKDLSAQLKSYSEESISFQILLLEDSSSFCPLYLEESSLLEQRTIDIGEQLTYLEEYKGVYDEDLKKEYFLLETKAYLLATKVKELCNSEKNLILYLYSKDCEDCILQGKQLNAIALDFGDNVRIYSFDGELDSPVVESFKNKYYVTSYPTLIINGKKFTGFQEQSELLKILD